MLVGLFNDQPLTGNIELEYDWAQPQIKAAEKKPQAAKKTDNKIGVMRTKTNLRAAVDTEKLPQKNVLP